MKAKSMAITMALGAAGALGIGFLMTNKKAMNKTKKVVNNTMDSIENKYKELM